jgi:hypothetical protein
LGPPKPPSGLGLAQAFRARLPRLLGFEPSLANHYTSDVRLVERDKIAEESTCD